MSGLKVDYRSPDSLTGNPRNARSHSPRQIAKLARSIDRFGFNVPILIDDRDCVIAGHGRLEAAKTAGLKTVPVIRLEHLSDEQKRAFIIADNRLAELGSWDRSVLAVELKELIELDLDFELSDTGFEVGEIDVLLNEQNDRCPPEKADPDDNILQVAGPPIAKPGDLWLLGNHRLFCGNALEEASYAALVGAERAELAFTDPPYNVPIDGHASGLGRVHHGDFLMAAGEMSEAEFVRFLTQAFRRMVEASEDGSIHFVCMDWRHLWELLRAGRVVYSTLKNLCVWDKGVAGMGSMYRSQHEIVAVFKNGTGPHINNIELSRYGRYRSNVWKYPGFNGFQAGRDEALASHPTVKPVGLVADAILDCSSPKGLILDPFAGSGTTIIAAERTRRRCAAIELDPTYVDVALRRFRRITGIDPIDTGTGKTLAEREAELLTHEDKEVHRQEESNVT